MIWAMVQSYGSMYAQFHYELVVLYFVWTEFNYKIVIPSQNKVALEVTSITLYFCWVLKTQDCHLEMLLYLKTVRKNINPTYK